MNQRRNGIRRAGRFIAQSRGAFTQPLDVYLSPSLAQRMEEMGITPPGAIQVAPRRATKAEMEALGAALEAREPQPVSGPYLRSSRSGRILGLTIQ